jgi:DNA invertase Pin-like site-specific DNA recombinase
MFQLLGVFAEFERAIIVERVRAGIARARAKGKRLGRPPGSRTKPDVETKIRTLLGQGVGMVRVGKLVGVGPSTV